MASLPKKRRVSPAPGASEHVSAFLGTGGALTVKMRGSKFSFSLRPSERYPLDARTPASLRSLALFSFLRRSRRSVPANQRLHGFLDRQRFFVPQDISSFLVSSHLSTSHLFLHLFSSDVEFPQSILSHITSHFFCKKPHSEDNPRGQDQKVYRLRY